MHHGVFCGKNANTQPKRILILGESHHINTDAGEEGNKIAGVAATYTTCANVEDYLANPTRSSYRFYDKIMQTFGYAPETGQNRENFWNSVYFGNYIDVLCGIGDDQAKSYVGKAENRKKLNNQLFQFVNEHQIDIIFCFGITATYDKLPSLTSKNEHKLSREIVIGKKPGNQKNIYLRECHYDANTEHNWVDIKLTRDLHVFGITHPSSKGGYPVEIYQSKLEGTLQISE